MNSLGVEKHSVHVDRGRLLHSLECHNWHIGRYGHCLYCDLGSRPVPGCLIADKGDK